MLPPVPSENENTQPEQPDVKPEDDQDEPEVIEPEIPDIPQELTEGDIYHYGRNTGRQVGLRKAPSKNADRINRVIHRLEWELPNYAVASAKGLLVWILGSFIA